MKKRILSLLFLLFCFIVSAQDCNSLRKPNETYGVGEGKDASWCNMQNPTAYTDCMCKQEKANKSSKSTNINADDTFDRYNQLNDKYQSLYAKVRNLGYDDVDEKLEILHSIKSYAAGLDALQNSTSYTANLNSDIQALEQQKKQQTITLSGKSSKANTYMTQKKAKAQETLKEIEIEQERERKAQEREALKSKNYYKTSPNTIRTGGYPQNGYNQAMQNINRMDANYDALKQSINKLANTFSSGTKSKSIDLDEIDQYNSNQDRVRDRRKQELQAIYDAFTIIYTINEGDDYPFLETGIYSDEYKTFIETLQHTTATHLFVKYIGWEKLAGAENIKAYHSMSKMYMGSKNEFDSNERPVFKVLFGNTQSIPVTEILEHPYLFSLYMEGLPKKVISLSPATFSGKEVTAVADCHFMFLDESVLDQMVGQIKSTYQSANTLQFDSYYKTYQKPFHQYVSENLQKEQQFNQYGDPTELAKSQRKNAAIIKEQIKNGTYNGYATYTFNGDYKYEGYWENGKRSGTGTFYFPDGRKYTGEWRNNNYDGQGTFYNANGTIDYEGRYLNNQYNGQGKKYYTDGDKYIGNFKDGEKNGFGTYYWKSGTKYVGNWENGKHNGLGTMYYTDGDKYEGDWKNGKRNGLGTYHFADGRKYIGNWENDKYNGQGTYYNSDGTKKYEGNYSYGKYEGKGIEYYANGNKYEGNFKDGERHGQGTYYFANGTEKHEGNWKYGKNEGQGTHYYPDGARYEGNFKDNKKHGQGTYYFANGEKYIGNWKDGNFHGKATSYFADGSKFEGSFKDGKMHGEGVYYFPDSTKYVGGFIEGNFEGQATKYRADGSIEYKGNYKKNEKEGEGIMYYTDGTKFEGTFKEGEIFNGIIYDSNGKQINKVVNGKKQ